MDKVHKPITTQYYTPSLKHFRRYYEVHRFAVVFFETAPLDHYGYTSLLSRFD
jgi:hypothetical protein